MGQLRIHLACWAGKCEHMVKLLGAFPETIWVGFNGSVGFAKATVTHECAFDIPLGKLLLESDAPLVIPAPVASAMGRGAFCHSGLIPFVADAVSGVKKGAASAVEVARAAAENTALLYGGGINARFRAWAEEAVEAAAAVAAAGGACGVVCGAAAVAGGEEKRDGGAGGSRGGVLSQSVGGGGSGGGSSRGGGDVGGESDWMAQEIARGGEE